MLQSDAYVVFSNGKNSSYLTIVEHILQAKIGGTEYRRLAYLMVMRRVARMLLEMSPLVAKINTPYLHTMEYPLKFRSITFKSSEKSDLGYIGRKFRSH